MKNLLIASLLLTGSLALAQKPKAKAGSDKITGEVVDVTCFANHGAKGEKHAACAQKCLSGGMPAGILAGNVLYIATMSDHSSPSAKLAEWAGKTVTAEGTKVDKNGTHIFEIASVAPAAK